MCKFSSHIAIKAAAIVLTLFALVSATPDVFTPSMAADSTSAMFRNSVPIRGNCQTDSILLRDVDNDGDTDLVKAAGSCGLILHLNNGKGVFDDGRHIGSPIDQVASIAMGDIDADGDPDLIVGGLGRTILVHLNNGKGGFAVQGLEFSAESVYARSMALADVDGDGDLDLVVGALNRPARLFLNDGSGTFSSVSLSIGTSAEDPQSLALGDVDNDGDIDLISGGGGEPILSTDGDRGAINLYRNSSGAGFRSDAIRIKKKGQVRTVILVDIDGDGDLDLYAGSHGERYFFLNNGKGGFTETKIGLESPDSYGAAAFGDVDGDGDMDAIVTNEMSPNRLYFNDGKGRFSQIASIPFGKERGYTCCFALADINGDRSLDIISISAASIDGDTFVNASSRPPAVFLPDLLKVSVRARTVSSPAAASGAIFEPIEPLLIKQRADNMAWSDFDLDGDPDVVLASVEDGRPLLTFYRNDGRLAFTRYATIKFATGDALRGISFADLDKDGDPDLLVAHYGHVNTVHLNDGTGKFSSVGIEIGTQADRTTHLIGRDIDNDGDIDLIASNHGNSVRYMNDGSARFGVGIAINSDSGNSNSVVAEDIDHDGDIDVVLGNGASNGSINLYRNVGDRTFETTDTRIKDSSSAVWMLLTGDIDNNDTLDLVVAGDLLVVLSNQGQGKFDEGVVLDGGRNIALGDVDLDGDLDIVSGDYSNPVRLLRNVGHGGWVPGVGVIDQSRTQALALLDMDADGDLDLVILSTEKGGVAVFANSTRRGAADEHFIASRAQSVTTKAPIREAASPGSHSPSTIRIGGFLEVNYIVLIVFGFLVPFALYHLLRRKS